MTQLTIEQAYDQAILHHQAGRLKEAEHIYRQILAHQPQHAGAVQHLGVIANQVGELDAAVDWIRRAIAIQPNYPQAYCNLGLALGRRGQLDEGIAALRQAILLDANYPEAHITLGAFLRDKGEFDESIAISRKVIAINPNLPEPHNNLGNALRAKGQLDEAIAAFHRAIALRPNLAEPHANLGTALRDKGELDQAIAAYRQALAIRPNSAQFLTFLGVALRDQKQLDESIAAHRQAIALKPDYADSYNHLGFALRDKGQLDEAIAAFHQAIALRPNFPEAHVHLGNALKDAGRLDEAIAAYRRGSALDPNYADAESNLILALHYHPDYHAPAIAGGQRRCNRQYAEPLGQFIRPHSNDRSPDRRLRIGYVSPDFKDHPAGRNLLPLFQHHDRRLFEIFAYAQVYRPDAITRQFQQRADGWRKIFGLTDEEVATQIRQDRIDILVDLALHTGGNRLLAFARKPSPVQVTYLGYCGSTGLDAIDYRVSDPHIDPPGSDESHYTEKTIRLPKTYWCYQPGVDPTPDVCPSPAITNGFVTFGCQNNYCKITAPVWTAWTAILRALPNSKILIYSPRGSHRETARKILADSGVDSNRLLFSESRQLEYFQRYNQIDIALDPFPFGGGTTTCDALWMGVPVITLWGKTAVGRGGGSILSNLGLERLIAPSPEKYVQIAVDLASDLDQMKSLRQNMRARMLASPLMDAESFTRDMESAYRQMWRNWCESPSAV